MATETLELEPDAFWAMVTKENLKVDGPSAGYMWAGKQGKNGWEMYKTRAQPIGWLYQSQRVLTQTNGGGGQLTMKISVPTGTVGRIVAMKFVGTASAGATLNVTVNDEDDNIVIPLATVTAGANRQANFPAPGVNASATNNNDATSTFCLVGPGMTIKAASSAALQNETLTVRLVMLLSTATIPTYDVSASAGTPSLAASTISAENTMQAVYL